MRMEEVGVVRRMASRCEFCSSKRLASSAPPSLKRMRTRRRREASFQAGPGQVPLSVIDWSTTGREKSTWIHSPIPPFLLPVTQAVASSLSMALAGAVAEAGLALVAGALFEAVAFLRSG